jgi:ketosteroid isomerase-like protein
MAKKASSKKTRARARAKTAKPQGRKRPATKAAAAKRVRPAAVANPVRALAQRIVDLTVRHEDEGALALYADNIESVEQGMPPGVGMDAIRQKFKMWRATVSDSTWRARNVWVDGNTIIVEWTGRVTFTATGRQADLNEVAIHEVQNGKIVRERFYYDRSALQP